MLAIALLTLALIVKAIYYLRFRTPVVEHTINSALPLGQKTIRLLDVGHTHGTFLTDEFFFKVARGHALSVRVAAIAIGFVLPIAVLASGASGVVPLVFAALACVVGLIAERWLFFAEAQHVIRLYHGATRV